ncbi:MAG: hypothetical protein HYV16_03880 [Gammaproteobacteria bacterium]|nr:hypothetical protein [Gammaproteobacteria bacterium]
MTDWMKLMTRGCALLLLAFALGGCGSRFVYNRLDTLARWQLDDYIELDEAQEQWLRQRLGAQLEQHRRQALPRYADWLEALDRDLAQPMDRATLDGHFERFYALRQELVRQMLADGTELLAGLSEEQVGALFEALEEDNQDYAEEYVALPKDKLLKKRMKELSGSFKDWVGALRGAEEQRLKQWLGEIQLSSADQLEFQRAWQAELRAALAYRQDRPRFAARIEQLFLEPEHLRPAAFQAKIDNNIEAFRRLVLDLNGQLSDKQRNKLRRKLRGYAEDFRDWAKDS